MLCVMGDLTVTREMLAAKFGSIFPHLDERQRRLLLGAEARALGHGGIRLVAAAAGVREGTVSLGARELESGEEPLGRARRPGGGRKPLPQAEPAGPACFRSSSSNRATRARRCSGRASRSGRWLKSWAAGGPLSVDTVLGLLRRAGVNRPGQRQAVAVRTSTTDRAA